MLIRQMSNEKIILKKQNYEYTKSVVPSTVKNNEDNINVLENLENIKKDKEKKPKII